MCYYIAICFSTMLIGVFGVMPSLSKNTENLTAPPPKLQANAGCLVKVNGLMLAVRTVKSGKWDIPSGKPENDETPDQTAVRETFEETGLKVRAEELLENFNGEFYVYRCKIEGQNCLEEKKHLTVPLTATNEISEVAYIDIDTLNDNNMRFPSILSRLKDLFKMLS